MDKDVQSKKWNLTINNPDDHGITAEGLKDILHNMPLIYTCFRKEISTTGTPHFHVYILTKSAMRFSTLKRRFDVAHIEKAQGTSQENRDYIRKEGKWADTDKAETSVPDSFWEYGDMPSPAEEKSPDKAIIIALIRAGYTDVEILDINPGFAFKLKDMALLRQTLMSDKYHEECRKVTVIYMYGPNAEAMTNYIYSQYVARDICRIISFKGKSITFDSYTAEDVLLLERFRSDIPLRDVLNYCSGYPTMLPARYADRAACYTRLYITSDLAPDLQYTSGEYSVARVKEFFNRIDEVIEFMEDGTMIVRKSKEAAGKKGENDIK